MGRNSILASMAVEISANNAKFNAVIRQSQTQLQKLNKTVGTVTGAMGIAFGATAIFSGLRYGTDVIIGFEKRMSEVRAITGATGTEFEALRKNALELGGATRFTAEQVAELQVAYGRLGFTTQEITDVTAATLDLATATSEDLAKSADIAGSTLRAFGLQSREMKRVIDVMAESFNVSALGLDNFSEAIKYVAPVAASANISLEETTAMLGVLADNGIRGSQAGTSLRKIISDVKNETGTLAERLGKLAQKGFTGADAMDEVGRTAYASLLILVKATEKTDLLTAALENAAGAAEKTADIVEDNLAGDLVQMTSAMDGFILKFSDGADSMRDFVQAITDLIKIMSEDEVINFLKDWAALVTIIPRWAIKGAAAAGEALKGLGKLSRQESEALRLELGLLKIELDSFGGATAAREAEIIKRMAEITSLLGVNFGTTEDPLPWANNKKAEEVVKIVSAIQSLKEAVKWKQPSGGIKPKLPDWATWTPDENNLDAPNPHINVLPSEDELWKQVDAILQIGEAYKSYGDIVMDTNEEIEKSIEDIGPAIANSVASIAAGLGQAAVGAEDFGDTILKSLGGFMQAFGGALLTTGIGKVSFDSFGGPAMIAAGAVLVAAGAALQSTISNRPDLSRSGGSGSGGVGNSGSIGSLQAKGLEITIGGEWTIKGDDLVYIINRRNQLNGRTKG